MAGTVISGMGCVPAPPFPHDYADFIRARQPGHSPSAITLAAGRVSKTAPSD